MLPPLVGSPVLLDGKSVPHGCTIRSLLLFLVFFSLRRSPLAVFLAHVSLRRSSRCACMACYVGGSCTCTHAVGWCVVRLVLLPCLFLLLLSSSFSFSLSVLSASASAQPKPALSCCLMSREDIIVVFKPSQSWEPWAICCRFCLALLVCGIGSL